MNYGFKKTDDPIYPWDKTISEEDKENGFLGAIALCATVERDPKGEFALIMPDGATLYLYVKDYEQLKAFEDSIESWSPNY